ncbi:MULTISPECIES: methyltransferase domain-containing protein [unclassified Streptomyces]|uniref:Protein-L-isoaspartate O-methyltransferase n=1 Tax=Streptomyces sp. NBC_00060 TaxID=2975636 RepID=A0AAU2GTH1_9ACTN
MTGPEELAHRLRADGYLTEVWYEPFVYVRREDFIPDRIWVQADDGYRRLERDENPGRWLSLVYDDVALVTQVEDEHNGLALVPSSSSSMPRVVATMLETLDVADGMSVLEIGTGTGYNAALLSHRLGDARVTSIEIDPAVAETARERLAKAGHHPNVITGDGTTAAPGQRPVDRVIVTCALGSVPYALVNHTRPGGRIVLPWGTGLYNGVLLRLDVHADGSASGPVIGDCAFMWNRAEAVHRDVTTVIHHDDPAEVSHTGLDPRRVLGDENAAFVTGLLVPDCRYSVGHGPNNEFTLWLADHRTGSWASIDYTPGAATYETAQFGPRRLWEEAEAAMRWWQSAGEPVRTRFGITITSTDQWTWLDTPDLRMTAG